MELQSTEPGLWNQPKLEQDPCCVTKESNDLEKVLQPLWASVSSEARRLLPTQVFLATNSAAFYRDIAEISGWQRNQNALSTQIRLGQARVQGHAAGSWLAWN